MVSITGSAPCINAVTVVPSNASETKPLSLSPSNIRFLSAPRERFRVRVEVSVRVSSSFDPKTERRSNPLIQNIQTAGKALVITTAALLMVGKLYQFPARAESPVAVVGSEEEEEVEDKTKVKEQQVVVEENEEKREKKSKEEPMLSQFLESHPEAINELRSLVMKRLEDGEDEEALETLRSLASAQPAELQWRILMGRLLNEIGEKAQARKVFEEVLSVNPLCFEVLFLKSLLMDQCGEGHIALQQLREALDLAKKSETEKDANNVRLIMAQIYYLQKNFDEALKNYQEVSKQDPKDYRPYFYQGIIYHQLDRKQESNEQFAKCREICPDKFNVEVFLQNALSRVKIFGTESNN